MTQPWLVALLAGALIAPSYGHDDGQWGNSDPAVVEWFRTLMMPDAPERACCGEADAYWTTDPYVRDGKTYVKIEDPRADEPLHRPHRENGTEILIPDYKLKWDRGNPTGHPIVFLSGGGWVYCFVQGSGA